MAQLAIQTRSGSGRCAGTAAAIDRGHLARMTFGDRSLERELLELFDRQAAMLIVRMRAGGAAAIATLAHTLKGSASGIGAGGVARAAEAAELAAGRSPAECSLAIDRLAQAVDEARARSSPSCCASTERRTALADGAASPNDYIRGARSANSGAAVSRNRSPCRRSPISIPAAPPARSTPRSARP